MALRASWGWTQDVMANQLGLSLRAYQDLESGHADIRLMLILALERLSLSAAAVDRRTDRLMKTVRLDIEILSSLSK